MIFRAYIAAALILISHAVYSQEKYVIDWDYAGQSFEDFVLKTESRYPVRFFYNEEWISGLTLGSYGGRGCSAKYSIRFLKEDQFTGMALNRKHHSYKILCNQTS